MLACDLCGTGELRRHHEHGYVRAGIEGGGDLWACLRTHSYHKHLGCKIETSVKCCAAMLRRSTKEHLLTALFESLAMIHACFHVLLCCRRANAWWLSCRSSSAQMSMRALNACAAACRGEWPFWSADLRGSSYSHLLRWEYGPRKLQFPVLAQLDSQTLYMQCLCQCFVVGGLCDRQACICMVCTYIVQCR